MQTWCCPAWRRAAPLRLPAAGLAHALLLRAADPNAQGLDEDADIFWPSPRRFQYSPPGWSEVFMALSPSWMGLLYFGSHMEDGSS